MTLAILLNRFFGVAMFIAMCGNLANGRWGWAIFDILLIILCAINEYVAHAD